MVNDLGIGRYVERNFMQKMVSKKDFDMILFQDVFNETLMQAPGKT